ncbi:hypothetical protein DFJ74DRAFT_648437 [Hyaloraphidium curvatum]|nr:hypothetical protein DFJ74DRAFT_648437 [Hyaloraphidium curvatum]
MIAPADSESGSAEPDVAPRPQSVPTAEPDAPRLPPELWTDVFWRLQRDKKALARCAAASKEFHELAMPILLHSVDETAASLPAFRRVLDSPVLASMIRDFRVFSWSFSRARVEPEAVVAWFRAATCVQIIQLVDPSIATLDAISGAVGELQHLKELRFHLEEQQLCERLSGFVYPSSLEVLYFFLSGCSLPGAVLPAIDERSPNLRSLDLFIADQDSAFLARMASHHPRLVSAVDTLYGNPRSLAPIFFRHSLLNLRDLTLNFERYKPDTELWTAICSTENAIGRLQIGFFSTALLCAAVPRARELCIQICYHTIPKGQISRVETAHAAADRHRVVQDLGRRKGARAGLRAAAPVGQVCLARGTPIHPP